MNDYKKAGEDLKRALAELDFTAELNVGMLKRGAIPRLDIDAIPYNVNEVFGKFAAQHHDGDTMADVFNEREAAFKKFFNQKLGTRISEEGQAAMRDSFAIDFETCEYHGMPSPGNTDRRFTVIDGASVGKSTSAILYKICEMLDVDSQIADAWTHDGKQAKPVLKLSVSRVRTAIAAWGEV